MLKSILSLKGAQELNNLEQENLVGGLGPVVMGCCNPANDCCIPDFNGIGCDWKHSPGACF